MKKTEWQKAFGNIPSDYERLLNGTLNGLTETHARRIIRKPVLVLAASLVLILSIAAAAGTPHLFNIFGKTPLDGAEDSIVKIDSEPIAINENITAAIDYAYYDGVDFYYEMTLTISEPDKYRIFCEDNDLYLSTYVPSDSFTALDVTTYLFKPMEIINELGEEYRPENPSSERYIEHIGDGTYKLYETYHYDAPEGVTLPDEMDLDVTLDIRYNPTVEDYHLLEPVTAEIPFHVTKTAPSGSYDLILNQQPEGWIITSAKYTQSDISGHIAIDYNFGGPVIENPLHANGTDLEQLEESLLMDSYSYIFRMIEPETGAVIAENRAGWSDYEFFTCVIDTPPYDPIPEVFTIEVVQENHTIVDTFTDEYGDDVVEFETSEVSLGILKFGITRD